MSDIVEYLHFEITKLKNLTTEINLLKNQSDQKVEAIEFDDKHVGLEVAEKSCSHGQLVDIEGVLHFSGQQRTMQIHGKIVLVTKVGNGKLRIKIELHSFDKDLWWLFTKAAKEDQEQVDKIFKAIKGEDE